MYSIKDPWDTLTFPEKFIWEEYTMCVSTRRNVKNIFILNISDFQSHTFYILKVFKKVSEYHFIEW